MFIKEKFLPDGEFERLKARLVAGGHEQDRTVYDDVSSPTVSLPSTLMVVALAAKEHREVVVVDIAGAYLNAALKNKEIFMKLDPIQSKLLVKLEPKYKEYVGTDGTITVQLLKALYGCIESAKLWYEHIAATLVGIGFVANPLDTCVFNRMSGTGKQCTVAVYVDDLLITCECSEEIDALVKHLKIVYRTIKVSRGSKVVNYLGMSMDFRTMGEVSITMRGYVEQLLSSLDVQGTVNTPASLRLFDIRESQLLEGCEKERFHSVVAKLLYLAKRARPDILTAVAFLATRVNAPTVDDQAKLHRVLKYLNGCSQLGIVLRPGSYVSLTAHIDASYGVHSDGKSHSGISIALGDGPIFVRSVKQRLVTKSSSEAELVAVADESTQVFWSRSFLQHQGYKLPPAKVYQDNMSTIAMVKKGKHTSSRSRHIHIRYFYLKDKIESGEVHVEHLGTNDMLSDILTKPLQGEQFRKLRNALMNWTFEARQI
jgi:histone deacetylase 1/2